MKDLFSSQPRSRSSAVILSLICLANLPSWGVGASINWNPVSVVSGDTDVSSAGAADRAWLFAGGSTTINGVTFTTFGGGDTQVSLGGTYGGFGEGSPFGNLSAAYRTLLTNGYYANGTTASVTLNNLNIGLDYQVQAWVNDSRSCCSGRSESISGSGSLAYSTLPGASGGVGSFVTGNFTADATNQVLSITANQSAQMNGLQLRATGVSTGNTATITDARNWSALTLGSGATIKYNLAASAQQVTALSGSGSLEQAGTGVLTLTGVQIYTGATNITGGTLRPAAATGSTLWLDAAKTGSITLSGSAVSQWNDAAGGVNFASQATSAARPNLSTDNAFTGVSKSMVDFGSSGNSGQTMAFNNNLTDIRSAFWVMKGSGFLLGSTGAYDFHRDDPLGVTSNIWHSTYTAGNIQSGQTYLNGTLVNGTTTALSGNYQMIDLVTAGNVQANSLANDRNIGGRVGGQQIGEVIIFNTALTATERQRVESYLNYKWFGIGSGVGNLLPVTTAVTISNGGTLDLSGVNYQTVASLASADTTSRVTLGSAAFTAGDATDTTFAGTISEGGSFIKAGAGTLTLSGNNTHLKTIVTSGVLKAASDSALGTSDATVSVTSGGSIDINGRTLQGYTQNIQIAGAGVSPTFGALGNSGGVNMSAIRGITLTANASIGDNGGRWDVGRLDFNADPNSTSNHIDGGGFVLTKVGSGYLGLLTGSTNLAGFIINGGTVAPHENTAFGAGPVTLNSGIIQPWAGLNLANAFTLNGGAVQTDGFNDNYNGPITLGGPVTINPTNGAITFNGNVSGNGALTKTGGNWLVITGNNTQTGLLTVNGGNVQFASATGNATQGNVTMTSSGSFLVMAAPNQFGPNSGMLFNSPGHSEMALYGNNQTIASLASTNVFAVVQNSHSGIGPATASSTLTVNQSTDTVYSGYVRDNTGNDAFKLGLTKSGPGKLTLEGGNIAYTGLTTITNGTLALGSGASLPDGNAVVLAGSTSTFDISAITATGDKIGSLNSVAGSTVNLGAKALEFGDSVDAIAAGNFTGTGGSITKSGSGVQTISGNNTYTGSTNLNGGTLLLGASNTLPDTAALNLSSGTTLKTGGFSDATGPLSVNGNAIIDMANGDSVLNFSSVGTWTGVLSIWNYTGAPWTLGTDKLTFASNQGNIDLNKVEFYSGNGTGLIGTGGGGLISNELVPVPEPSTTLAAVLLLGTLGYRERRRLLHYR